MLSVRRTLVALALMVAIGCRAGEAPLRLPPVEGNFSGAFSALKLAGAPKLQWTLGVVRADEQRRKATLEIGGDGTRLRVETTVDLAGNGTWSIVEGELDLAQWFPVAAPEIGAAATGVTASGKIALAGGGEMTNGRPSGVARFELNDGRFRSEEGGWSVDGVAARGEFGIYPAEPFARMAGPIELEIATITTTRFGARNLFARGRVNEGGTISLTEGRIEIAGGEVIVDPATVPLFPPRIDLNLRVSNVGLQDIAALAPAGLSDARGRIDGAVRVSWDEAGGFRLGVGELRLGPNEPAVVRLASTPGFLTDRVPKQISLLPDWAGPLARWFRPENPAYRDMEQIELGRTELRVQSLVVRLTPNGDDRGRTATIEIAAEPMQAQSVVERVTFQINVSGPLMDVVKLGLEQSFTIEMQ